MAVGARRDCDLLIACCGESRHRDITMLAVGDPADVQRADTRGHVLRLTTFGPLYNCLQRPSQTEGLNIFLTAESDNDR